MKSLRFFLVLAGLAAASGCGTHESPNFIYMPDMVYSPAIKAQTGHMAAPVPGTVSRNFVSYPFKKNLVTDSVVANNPNPLRATPEVLARGRAMFNTYCIVCHGPNGEGDGTIVPKFPRPPSLQSNKILGYKDGQIFHVATMGQNLMPSYASQVAVSDRWAIIHYIRALQKSKHPTSEDLKAAEAE